MTGVADRKNYSRGAREHGRFKVHPDKILLRVWPIKGITQRESGIWIPPSTQKREAKGRWARVLQVGDRLKTMYGDMYQEGDLVLCHRYVAEQFGLTGKFRLSGKLVCVTVPSEILMKIEFDDGDSVEEFMDRVVFKVEI